eukprot:350682-Chlamydomonas_euryale.AAC.8
MRGRAGCGRHGGSPECRFVAHTVGIMCDVGKPVTRNWACAVVGAVTCVARQAVSSRVAAPVATALRARRATACQA